MSADLVETRLTAHAVKDVRSILATTQRLFGPGQVQTYSALLTRAVALLAHDPYRAGSRARPELGPPVRSFHAACAAGRARASRHELIYAINRNDAGQDELVILRVLHDAMDPARRVGAALRDDLRRS